MKDSIQLVGGPRMATEVQAHGLSVPMAHFQHVIATEVGAVARVVPRYLARAGGSVEMNVDGSGTPIAFDLAPGSSQIWRVARLSLLLVATSGPTWPQFGNLAPLANGLALQVRSAGTVITDLTAGQAWRSNRDLAIAWCTAIEDALVTAEWRFAAPLRLEGGHGELLRLTVQDDLSALTRLRVLAECLEETDLT